MSLLILDTDPGVDDALALLYLRARNQQKWPDLKLLAITTVFGNADVETTTRNALWLRARLGLSAPVYRGAAEPLTRPRGLSPKHVHGENGLGDLDLSGAPLSPAGSGAAHERIIDLVRARPREITIVAIGPLTNLALALRAAPDVAGLVAGVTIMGGAFAAGNVTPFAEANIHNDPEAAAEGMLVDALHRPLEHEAVQARDVRAAPYCRCHRSGVPHDRLLLCNWPSYSCEDPAAAR